MISTIFAFLYLIAFIGFIVFLVKGIKAKKSGEDNKNFTKLASICLLLLIVMLTGCQKKKEDLPVAASNKTSETAKTETETPEKVVPSEVVVDLDTHDDYIYLNKDYKDAKLVTPNKEEVTITGNIDYSKPGTYDVKVSYVKADTGEKVESNKTVYVGDDKQIEQEKAAQAERKTSQKNQNNNQTITTKPAETTNDGKTTTNQLDYSSDIVSLAQWYTENTSGVCGAIEKRFITEYMGLSGYDERCETPISEADARPGDIIAYDQDHIAVYLGNGMALHGGIQGNNVRILPVDLSNTGNHYFYRYEPDNPTNAGSYADIYGSDNHIIQVDVSEEEFKELTQQQAEENNQEDLFVSEEELNSNQTYLDYYNYYSGVCTVENFETTCLGTSGDEAAACVAACIKIYDDAHR